MTISEKVKSGMHWVYFRAEDMEDKMSGWKIHIFGEDVDDSIFVAENLQGVLDKYRMAMKVASNIVYQAGIGIPGNKQYGKCGTMYLPPFIFKENRLQEFIGDVQLALKGYTKTGDIIGDKSLDGTIHYRYELYKPIDITEGVNHSVYSVLYEPNRGSHNIPDNDDPFEGIKINSYEMG